VNYSCVLFLLHLHCCTDCMDNRPGVSAVCSLPVPQRLAHAAFIHRIILSLCQLLTLNDDYDDDDDFADKS